ncbi:MAG: hypothetical protein LBU32_30820 [Clostridiales bacterium]|nr:hypothetical protein [Clostridiales bacterium]
MALGDNLPDGISNNPKQSAGYRAASLPGCAKTRGAGNALGYPPIPYGNRKPLRAPRRRCQDERA